MANITRAQAVGLTVSGMTESVDELLVEFTNGQSVRHRKRPLPESFNSIQRLENILNEHKSAKLDKAHVPYPVKGSVISYRCDGFNRYGQIADGNGKSRERILETNSIACGYVPFPAPGLVLGHHCEGFTYIVTKADGNGGSYDTVVETNSFACGYVPPPAAGTVLGQVCVGVNKHDVVADGSGGSYNRLLQANSFDCGYVVPPPAVIDYAWSEPGTYEFVIPPGVSSMAVRVRGGNGGGGGGGGAGEQNWTGSAGGGGGGQGGGGQDLIAVYAVTEGQRFTIVVGSGGSAGLGAGGFWVGLGTKYGRYTGNPGGAGGEGSPSALHPLLVASGGNGGAGGAGGPPDSRYALVAGGVSGAGWPAGAAGKYNHNGSLLLGRPNSGRTNVVGGPGGVIPTAGGAGGAGGSWGNPGWERYADSRIGRNGLAGENGKVVIQLTRVINFDITQYAFEGAVGSVPWPYA